MADEYTIKNEYEIASAGPCLAVCVDFINLGDSVEQYMDNPPRVVPKGALVFQIEERNRVTGKPFEPSVEKTLTFGNKAGLRKFLEAWRGRAYTDEEARKGAPLHKLVGQSAIVTIEHKTSAGGRTYANISNISPLMKGMAPLVPDHYVRSDHWEKRKADYAAKVREHLGEPEPAGVAPGTGPLADGDDDLPF